MIKLKNIISEGYAWEREEGKPLPTLADTTAAYARKLQEKAESTAQQQAAGIALAVKRGEQPMSALKGASKEMYKMSEDELEKIASTKHDDLPTHVHEAKPDYIDADGDGDKEESMKKAFADKEKDNADSSLSKYSDSALRDMKINLSRFEGNDEEIKDINRELEKRKNKQEKNESALIKKSGLQEMREIPLEDRILRNLKGNDYILKETFKK